MSINKFSFRKLWKILNVMLFVFLAVSSYFFVKEANPRIDLQIQIEKLNNRIIEIVQEMEPIRETYYKNYLENMQEINEQKNYWKAELDKIPAGKVYGQRNKYGTIISYNSDPVSQRIKLIHENQKI